MKKYLLLIVAFLLISNLQVFSQTPMFTAVEVKVKNFTQDNIAKEFDKVFEGVKMNKGAVVLQRFRSGNQNGRTHRIVFLSTLGTKLMEEGAINPDKNSVFWARMGNYVEDWGPAYHGRVLSRTNLDTTKYKFVHIWDIKVQNPNQYKEAHDNIVKTFQNEFEGRGAAFGTYDIGKPNGATHWVALWGKDVEDHLQLYDALEKSAKFYDLIQSRGVVEDIKDFTLEVIRRK